MGVAVQTCNLAVGFWVPWAAGGLGAVATQAAAERSYGPRGLAHIRQGRNAGEALSLQLKEDEHPEIRQVSIVDHSGAVATHTGDRCFPEAGSFAGDGFCTQANMMASDTVWGAMADAFQAAEGELAERLMVALEAAEGEGGDLRGKQTAALLVVGPERSSLPLVDLRVDHHEEPLRELRRLHRLHQAYMAEYSIAGLVDSGELAAAERLLKQIERWAPEEQYLQYLRAMHYAGRLDRWELALGILGPLTAAEPVWIEYLRREATVDNFGCPGLGKRMLEELGID